MTNFDGEKFMIYIRLLPAQKYLGHDVRVVKCDVTVRQMRHVFDSTGRWIDPRGGFFHSKGTWGCAAREGILFRTSSLAKGVLFGNFSRVRSRQGYAFWEFWSKRCQNSVIFVKKTQFLKNFGLESAKIWQVLPRKCQFRALLKEKLV